MRYEIPIIPVSWKAHQGYGANSFSPRQKEKEASKIILKILHKDRPLYNRAVRVDIFFEMPIPNNLAKSIIKKIDAGEKVYHNKRPDIDNLRKFASDTLIGTVLTDNAIIVKGTTEKYYSKKPKTIIEIEEIYD